ncbi:hypothetical protein CY35_17G007400 [Sphagnum magellanicum]|nr:hypothetical protein CY35_17G007400 [Sphagnum magellanicum]
MPLVRYELRSELRLANPQLYRTARKDDSEAVLEGVAMAALVGIVRQLGDLAEFAAEIFNGLHDEVMSIMVCCHELRARVLKLETDLPNVEKSLQSEATVFQLIYSPGADWHASLPSDNNHCTRGDLPDFLRNLYDKCRGPPRLFLLDKFDAEGEGACVKRYTDPSVFMKLWAESELKKAEQEQQKARTERKEAKLREKMESITSLDIKPRERYSVIHLGNLEGFSGSFIPTTKANVNLIQGLDQILESQKNGEQMPLQPSTSSTSSEEAQTPSLTSLAIHSVDVEAEDVEDSFARLDRSQENGDQMCLQHTTGPRFAEEAPTSLLVPIVTEYIDTEVENAEGNFQASSTMFQETDDQMPPNPTSSAEEAQAPPWTPLAVNSMDTESQNSEDDFERQSELNGNDTKLQEEEEDDDNSNSASFADALTTMDSEGELDTESRAWPDPDIHQLPPEIGLEEASALNHLVLNAHVESQRRSVPRGIDLLEEQEGLLPDMRSEPKHDLNGESSFLEHENYYRSGVESSSPCIPCGDFAEMGHDLHGSLSPEVVVLMAEDAETDHQTVSEFEAESPSEAADLSQEVKETAIVDLPIPKMQTDSQRQNLPEDMYLAEEQASPQQSREPHDNDVVFEPSSALIQDEVHQDEHDPCSNMESTEASVCIKQLDTEGEMSHSVVVSEIVNDKREGDDCCRSSVSDSEVQAWLSPEANHQTRESDQASLENCSSAWEKHVDYSQGHDGPFQVMDLMEQTFLPQWSIQHQQELRSELYPSQQEQPPPAVEESTALPMFLGNLGDDEDNDGNGIISKEFINNEGRQNVGEFRDSGSPVQSGPDIHEVTLQDKESLLNHSALAMHVESRRQRRRWDINWVEEQARLRQLAVEPEDDTVIESPEQQISSAVNFIEPELFLEYQGKIRGNGHSQLTSKTVGDKSELEESQGQGDPDVVGASVPAEAHIQSHAAPKKPVESRRQRASKSMHMEQAVYQTKLKHEDQPHAVTMLVKPPIFLEYLGRERENGDVPPITCNVVCGVEKLDDQGAAQTPGSKSQAHKFTEVDEALSSPPPLTHSALKRHVESRRQRARWDMNHVKKQLVLTEMRPEHDFMPGLQSVLNANEEPDSPVEASEPLMPPNEVLSSPLGNGHTQAVSGGWIMDDQEADTDSPEGSEPPMCPEVVGIANSPVVNDCAKVPSEPKVDNEETVRAALHVSEPPIAPEEVESEEPDLVLNGHAHVVSSDQMVHHDQELDCDSPDIKELILFSSGGPSSAADNVAAVDMDQGEEKLLHEHHNMIEEQELKNTFLLSLSSSPCTDLSSQNSDEDPEDLDNLSSLSSASSSQRFTPFSLLHSPAESPATFSHQLLLGSAGNSGNNWKLCCEQQGSSPQSSAACIPLLSSSSPMTTMQQLPIHHDSIDDWPIQSWSIWSRQAHLSSPPMSPVRQSESSPGQASSSTHSNQMSDTEIEEAHMDAVSHQHDILKEMSAIDVSQVRDNQNVLMELNRKQYHRWRCSGLQNRWGTSTVTGNDFNVTAIMEKANAIRQDIVGGSDEDEEEKEDQRNGQTSSPLSLNLLSTLDSKNLATSMLLDRTGL